MTINLNFQIKDMNGKPMQGEINHAGKLVSSMIASQSKGNSIKLYDWALKLWNNKALDMDDTDADVLIALIEETDQLTILAKVPIVNYIKGIKEKKK